MHKENSISDEIVVDLFFSLLAVAHESLATLFSRERKHFVFSAILHYLAMSSCISFASSGAVELEQCLYNNLHFAKPLMENFIKIFFKLR